MAETEVGYGGWRKHTSGGLSDTFQTTGRQSDFRSNHRSVICNYPKIQKFGGAKPSTQLRPWYLVLALVIKIRWFGAGAKHHKILYGDSWSCPSNTLRSIFLTRAMLMQCIHLGATFPYLFQFFAFYDDLWPWHLMNVNLCIFGFGSGGKEIGWGRGN